MGKVVESIIKIIFELLKELKMDKINRIEEKKKMIKEINVFNY